MSAIQGFRELVWVRLRLPAALIIVHAGVSLLALIGLYAVELLVKVISLTNKSVPGLSIPLGDLLFDLEVFAAAGIIVAGMLEALVVLILAIILDVVEKLKEIAAAWRR